MESSSSWFAFMKIFLRALLFVLRILSGSARIILEKTLDLELHSKEIQIKKTAVKHNYHL